jgi:hypothetical protein
MESAVAVDDARASASTTKSSVSGWAKVKKVLQASKEAQKKESIKDSEHAGFGFKKNVERVLSSSIVNKEGVGFKRLDDKKLEVALSQIEREDYDKFNIGAPWGGLITELLPMADKLLGIDDDFMDEDVTLKKAKSPDRHRRGKEKEKQKERIIEEDQTDEGNVAVAVAEVDSEQKHDKSHDVSAAMSKVEFVGSTARLEVLQRLLEKTQGGKATAQGGKATAEEKR